MDGLFEERIEPVVLLPEDDFAFLPRLQLRKGEEWLDLLRDDRFTVEEDVPVRLFCNRCRIFGCPRVFRGILIIRKV